MYRQLTGISRFAASALTWNCFNRETFPYPDVSLIADIGPHQHPNRIVRFFQKRLHSLQNAKYPTSPHWRQIRNWLLNKKPDIILCQFGPVGIEVLPIAQVLNIPTVCHFHGQDLSSLLNSDTNYKNQLIKNLDKFAAIVVVGSHQHQWMLDHGISQDKIHLIPCGVPTDDFKPQAKTDNGTIKFICVSRLVEKKGLDYTIQAFNITRDSINATLEIIGDGPLKPQITELISKSKYSGDIILSGELPHDQVRTRLYNADIFLQHSIIAPDGDSEGSPVAIAEAAAAGLPVISTRHAGIPDLVQDEITGYLVAEKDYNTMADKMISLANSFELRQQMATAAADRMKKYFDTKNQVAKLEDILLKETR